MVGEIDGLDLHEKKKEKRKNRTHEKNFTRVWNDSGKREKPEKRKNGNTNKKKVVLKTSKKAEKRIKNAHEQKKNRYENE